MTHRQLKLAQEVAWGRDPRSEDKKAIQALVNYVTSHSGVSIRGAEPRGEPWGHKYTVHVYIEGVPGDNDLSRIADAIDESVGGTEFVGVKFDPVHEKPKDQLDG